MSLTQPDREFLLKELEQVRKNYDSFIAETRQLEKYAVVVVGATWSWCASHTDSFAFSLPIWFPAVASALFGLRAAAIHYQARAAQRYIAKLERAFELSDQLGWATDQLTYSKGVPAVVAITAYVFWLIVSVGTVVIPLIFSSPSTK